MRIALHDGWTLWPVALLRGAGFPFAFVEGALASEQGALEAVRRPTFVEAIAWQNRRIYANALDKLKLGLPLDKERRRALRVLIRYIQRYGAKNDTIGFFGPLGWVQIEAEGAGHFEAAESLIAGRRVSFEPWAIKAVLAACPVAQAGAPLRLAAHLRLEKDWLIGPEHVLPVSEDEIALILLADGRHRAEVLATSGVAPEVCERLIDEGILHAFPPIAVDHDPAARAPASPLLMHFRERLETLSQAAGNASAVAAALKALDQDFENVTGRAAARHPGQTYAGRTLVYEDCRRGGTLALSSAARAPIDRSITLMGALARGYTFRIARSLCSAMLVLFRAHGQARVPLQRFWRLTDPLFEAEQPEAVKAQALALEKDWRDLFAARSAVSIEEAQARLLPLWQAPSPGWPGARHHSPDVMWQAVDAQALLAGRGMPILAEFHPGVSTFTTLSVLSLAPERSKLEQLWREDFPHPLVSPIPHEIFARSTQDARLSARHVHLDTGHGYVSAHDGAEVLRVADLDVIEDEGRLWGVTLDGRHRLDLMGILERRIKLRAATAFPVGPVGAGPRLMLGDVVLRRANWTGTPPAMPRDRFRPAVRDALRGWFSKLGAPARVFARVPDEVKPVLVDARSDLSLDMFAAMLDGRPVHLSEMLPEAEGLWLADAQGARYTAELRFTLCDPVPYDGAQLWRAAQARTRR